VSFDRFIRELDQILEKQVALTFLVHSFERKAFIALRCALRLREYESPFRGLYAVVLQGRDLYWTVAGSSEPRWSLAVPTPQRVLHHPVKVYFTSA